MDTTAVYPIGTPGKPWEAQEKRQWLNAQQIKRSYQQQVLAKLDAVPVDFNLTQYGALPYDESRYPLFLATPKIVDNQKPTILVTGGVHGYETSGVHGAIGFLLEKATDYLTYFNVIVAPCVSPWGYETINRWNPDAIDPNRSFYQDSPASEAKLLMQAIAKLNLPIFAHFDLHETTDTDNSEFRPALSARDAVYQAIWEIPDGFYSVGDTENPTPEFQGAIIASVEQVTHIAPADSNNMIIGAPIEQKGVINYSKLKLGLCGGFCRASYVCTTEVYPDSPTATPESCIEAQIAAIVGGLDYLVAQQS